MIQNTMVPLPSFAANPGSYLSAIAAQPSSSELCTNLAGSVASIVKDESHPQICLLYLQAASRHLSVVENAAVSDGSQRGKQVREVIEVSSTFVCMNKIDMILTSYHSLVISPFDRLLELLPRNVLLARPLPNRGLFPF
jgi:hypothetical protein